MWISPAMRMLYKSLHSFLAVKFTEMWKSRNTSDESLLDQSLNQWPVTAQPVTDNSYSYQLFHRRSRKYSSRSDIFSGQNKKPGIHAGFSANTQG
jgi:hypothetical protein